MTAEDFWSQVDSNSGWYSGGRYRATCSCWSQDDRHITSCDLVTDWGSLRSGEDSRGCLALKSDGSRCAERVTSTFPFCGRYHLEGALLAFVTHLEAVGAGNVVHGHFDDGALAIATLVHRGMFGHLSEKSKRQLAGHFGVEPAREMPAARPAKTKSSRRCSLYRHYDADGTLLYVGISVDPDARKRQHEATSPWWVFVESSDTDWFLTEVDAAAAERRAIVDESPIFNKAGAPGERDSRAIQYLIQHEAYELLRAAA